MKAVNNLSAQFGGDNHVPNRLWRNLVVGATVASDFIVVFATVVAVSFAYHASVLGVRTNIEVMLELALTISFVFIFTNAIQRRYRIGHYLTVDGQLLEAFNVWSVSIFAFAAVGFFSKVIDNYSRGVIVITYLLGVVMVPASRYLVSRVISIATKTGRIGAQHVLLVGRNADLIGFMTRHQPWNSGLVVQEMLVFEDRMPGQDAEAWSKSIADDLSFAVGRARQTKPDAIIIALPWSELDWIDRCVEAFLTVPVTISLAPEQIVERFQEPRISRIGSVSILELQPVRTGSMGHLAKQLFDFMTAIAGLVVLSPLFLIIAVMIKLDSHGPVFFFQRRYGFNQQAFRIVKFRTMTTLDDGDLVRQARKGDKRITRVGAWLRRWNLDELPQLVNVLQGQMSLVGPRPHALAHDHAYEQKIDLYARRHNVKPGITGWAQVNGLRGETDTDDKMMRRVAHDLWYIDNWSFWFDIAILFRTVFSRKAYRNAL